MVEIVGHAGRVRPSSNMSSTPLRRASDFERRRSRNGMSPTAPGAVKVVEQIVSDNSIVSSPLSTMTLNLNEIRSCKEDGEEIPAQLTSAQDQASNSAPGDPGSRKLGRHLALFVAALAFAACCDVSLSSTNPHAPHPLDHVHHAEPLR